VYPWLNKEHLQNGIAYLRIAELFEAAIRSGKLPNGTRIPTHRELARALNLNIGTVSRAYLEMKHRGLIESALRLGTYVRTNLGPQPEASGASDVVDLGTNTRVPVAFAPLFAKSLAEIAANEGVIHALESYKPIGGTALHREAAARWLSEPQHTVDPNSVLIVDGATSAALTAISATCPPGSTLLIEELSYPGLKLIANVLHINLEPVSMDDEGMVPDDLARAIKQHRPKALFLTPCLQNPTCVIYSKARIKELMQRVTEHGLWAIEDAVYRPLVPQAQRAPRLINSDYERAIEISSLSKCIAQGLRVGFILATAKMQQQLTARVQALAFSGPALMAEVASRWFNDGIAQRFLAMHRDSLSARTELAKHYLQHLGLISHPFSSHCWIPNLTLQQSAMLHADILTQGVRLRAGHEFSPNPARMTASGLRVTLGAARDIAELKIALNKIRSVLDRDSVSQAVYA
jgi:DNA-binding transcriptional MocR family regulator